MKDFFFFLRSLHSWVIFTTTSTLASLAWLCRFGMSVSIKLVEFPKKGDRVTRKWRYHCTRIIQQEKEERGRGEHIFYKRAGMKQ